MQPNLKKALKIGAISLASVFGLLLLTITLLIHVVFTSSKLTPIVTELANELLDAKVEIGEVDLTFFSTFPRFGLRIAEGSITVNPDSIAAQQTDSLLRFKECVAVVNPIAYLRHNEIRIRQLTLTDAHLYAYVNEGGIPNWNIVTPDTTEQVADTAAGSFKASIQIERFAIENAHVTFDDRYAQLYADIEGLNFALSGSLSEMESALKLSLTSQNSIVWSQGDLLLSKVAFGADAALMVNRTTRVIQLQQATFDVNGLTMDAKGAVQLDSIGQRMAMDIEMQLLVPDLATVLNLIPSSIVDKAVGVTASGEVTFKAALKGYYGKGQLPQLEGFAHVKKGRAAYKGMPFELENLDFRVDYLLNPMRRVPSYVHISNFDIKAASTNVSLMLKADNILQNPVLDAAVRGHIDITELAKTFPILPDITMKGEVEVDMGTLFNMQDVAQMNWSKIAASGMVKISDLSLISPVDSFELTVKGANIGLGTNAHSQMDVGKRELLSGVVGFEGLRIQQRNRLMAHLNGFSANFQSSPGNDTLTVGNLHAALSFKGLAAVSGDTLHVQAGGGTAKVSLIPYAKNRQLTAMRTTLQLDSIAARLGDLVTQLDVAGVNINMVPSMQGAKKMDTSGSLGFNQLQLFTPAFPLLATLSKSQIEFTSDYVTLNNARLDVGKSDLRLSGKVYNLPAILDHRNELRAVLTVRSDFIDCNELIQASIRGHRYVTDNTTTRYGEAGADAAIQIPTDAVAQTVDSEMPPTDGALFVVPKGVDFTLDTHLNKILFGTLEMDHFNAEVRLKDQSIALQQVGFNTLGATLKSDVVYTAKDTVSAYAGFDIKMLDIDIAKIMGIIPSIDSILPMLRSFEGKVDFHIAGETKLDNRMNFVLPSLRGAMSLQGENLVLLDGETFGEIAKMLSFKQKDRNMIDGIAVDLLVQDNQLEIFPFVVKMDKYTAVIGGKHNLNMTYNYHISALTPIRLGVNIQGKPDKMRFGIGAAKYRDMFLPNKRRHVDSTAFEVRNKVRASLMK